MKIVKASHSRRVIDGHRINGIVVTGVVMADVPIIRKLFIPQRDLERIGVTIGDLSHGRELIAYIDADTLGIALIFID